MPPDAPRCGQCGAPTGDQAYLCGACTEQLRHALFTVCWLAGDLDIAISRQARFADKAGRGGVGVLPYDPRAAEAKTSLHNELGGWVRVIGERTL
jgi:hypothetical protein